MAISRDKKEALVAELTELFANSKSSAGAVYTGLSVADLQALRKAGREQGVAIKVSKNRLIKVALSSVDKFKSADTSLLNGQLVYAFSNDDEIAPAQLLAKFAKTNPNLQLTVGFNDQGAILDTKSVQVLAELPSKDQLRGQMVSVIAAPLTKLLGVAGGAQRGFVQVLSQRAEAI